MSNTPVLPASAITMDPRLGSCNTRSSFIYDSGHGYTLRWPNLHHFEEWMSAECNSKNISFSVKETKVNKDPELLWIDKKIYVCARGFTGGRNKKFVKKNAWTRKIPVQRIGCSCRLTVKRYPGTTEVLGQYVDEHSHAVGTLNARFTPLPVETRREIERLLRLGVDPQKVLEQIRGEAPKFEGFVDPTTHSLSRNSFATAANVRQIQKSIEAEVVRLAKQDGASVLEWVKRLREKGFFVDIKASTDAAPENSNLDPSAFILIIQSPFQKMCWETYGRHFAGSSIIEYLEKNWLAPEVRAMWSAVYRTERNIFQDCDTNMLLEAWHHLLKGKFMEGKRNRRLDHLIFLLTETAEVHFISRHQNQECGFEGPNLEVQRRLQMEEAARKISADDIDSDDNANTFLVASQSSPGRRYTIDLDAYTCDCPTFPLVLLCKHILAVQTHFKEEIELISPSQLQIHSPDSFQSSTSNPTPNPNPQLEVLKVDRKRDITESISRKLNIISQELGIRDSRLDVPESVLEDLNGNLAKFLEAITPAGAPAILPARTSVAPNQHTWTETSQAMGVASKSKEKAKVPRPETSQVLGAHVKGKKRKNEDPYAGGERAGKKAKADALHRPTQAPSPPANTTSTSAFTPIPNSDIPDPIVEFAADLPPPSTSTIPLQLPVPSTLTPSVNLMDSDYLRSLKRKDLNSICRQNGIKTGKEKSETLIQMLAQKGASDLRVQSFMTSV
ncbi:hypothetical protein BKA70DRAFT_1478441 [Coprinopsis sp. MPI-PUGE-AT-0042]|nr:hypothetical protein BKA70DRAFT_1478441 [Coprinopsis sp. MPI-PUGE-AT-0042]